MAINRAALKEHLWPGIVEFFGSSYSDYPDQWSDIFTTRSSSKAYEEYVMEAFFGLAPPKAEGAPIIFDEASDVWKGRVEMIAYALGFVITREAVKDDQYFDMVPRYTRALKHSMKITKEVRAATFLGNVFTSSTTGDGVSVCNSAHPLKNGQTLSNVSPAAMDLNETALEMAVIAIGDFVNERGIQINVRPNRVVVPNEMQFMAERLFRTQARPGTSDNDINAHVSMSSVPGGYRVNNFLADPQAWFILTDVPEGMTHWEREALDLEEGDGAESQTMKVMAYERYAFSCIDPRSIYGIGA